MGCHSPAYWVGTVRVCSSRGRLSNSNPLLIRGPIKYLKRRGFAFAYAMSSFNDKPGLRPGINLSNTHTYKMYIAWTEMAQCWEHSIPSMSPGFEFWRRHWDEFVIESLLCSERFFSEHSVFAISSNTSMSKILVRSGPCTSIIE